MGLERSIVLPNKAFFSEAFINSVHANRTILLESTGVRVLSVSMHEALKFRGDLFGYLRANKIEAHLDAAILVLNNFNSQMDFSENTTLLYIPSVTDVQALVEQINLVS